MHYSSPAVPPRFEYDQWEGNRLLPPLRFLQEFNSTGFPSFGPVLRLMPAVLGLVEILHSLLPISAARRPPPVEAYFLTCSSFAGLFPSKSLHPLNFLLRFLPRSLFQGGPPDSASMHIQSTRLPNERQHSRRIGTSTFSSLPHQP
jgi:hypothetical protein